MAVRPLSITFLIGRLLFGGFFLWGGFNHFVNLGSLSTAAAGQGVPLASYAVLGTGALILFGGLGVMLGAFPRVSLVFIIIFLVGVTPVMHDFWTVAGDARVAVLSAFTRNVALLGAALSILSVPTPWPWSVSRGLQRAEADPSRHRPT